MDDVFSRYEIPENEAIIDKKLSRKDGRNIVVMRNDLIRAAHRLNLPAKRMLMLAISRFDSRKVIKPDGEEVKIKASEYADMFDASLNDAYGLLKRAVRALYDGDVEFDLSIAKKRRIRRVRWCTAIEYRDNEAMVSLKINHELMPYLKELKENFTSYKLADAARLKTVYAWRLFELLKQYESTGVVEIKLEDLHYALETQASHRKDFFNMRNRVLAPAIKDIEKNGYDVHWNPRKRGRSVVSVVFAISKKRQTELFTE